MLNKIMMKITFFIGIGVAFLSVSTNSIAEDSSRSGMMKRNAMVQQSPSNGNQPSLDNGGTKLPGHSNVGNDAPGKGGRFIGSQGKSNTSSSAGSWASSKPKTTSSQNKGVTEMINKGRGTNDQKSLPAFDRATQLQGLADPKGRMGNTTNSAGGLFGGDQRKFGKDGLTSNEGGSTVGTLAPGTVQTGDGKNAVSRQGMISSGKDKPNKYGGTSSHTKTYPDGEVYTFHRDQNGINRETVLSNELTGMTKHYFFDKDGKAIHPAGDGKEIKAPHTGGGKKFDPDEVDESTLPDSLKQYRKEKVKPSREEAEQAKKRQVTLPGEDKRPQGSRDVKPSTKDWVKKQTDGRINPVDGDGTTSGSAPAFKFDPITGKPIPGKEHGGGGDPPEPNE